jgi:asparagine synthase (glutamine-hydrolysing)
VNGEIYNHMTLKAGPLSSATFLTGSDCEVIIPLYQKYGSSSEGIKSICKELDGVFSFVLYDAAADTYIAGRDPIGVNPLYMGWGKDGSVLFASELKALHDTCHRVIEFLPGHFYCSQTSKVERWYNPVWYDKALKPSVPYDPAELRRNFETAVVKRMMSDVPWGVLLSGGLDSSLVAAICARHAKYRTENYERSKSGEPGISPRAEAKPAETLAHFPRLHSFCIGLKGSPDLAAAKQVADYLGTVHHAYTFTVADGVDAVRCVCVRACVRA